MTYEDYTDNMGYTAGTVCSEEEEQYWKQKEKEDIMINVPGTTMSREEERYWMLQELEDSIIDSGLVDDSDREQLLTNIAENFRTTTVYEGLEEKLLAALQFTREHNSSLLRNVCRRLYLEDRSLALVIYDELAYWISHEHRSNV